MPYSPYQKTFNYHQPITDLSAYQSALRSYRVYWEDDEKDKCEELVEDAEKLLEHCEFLIEKLSQEKCKTRELRESSKEFQNQMEELKEENQVHKAEVEKLKSQLDDARANAPGTKEWVYFTGNKELGTPKNVHLPSTESETSGPQKRIAEDDATVDGQPLKKGRMDEEGSGL